MRQKPDPFETIKLGNFKNPKQLIFLLHGIATDHETLRGVGESFAAAMPDAAILIPRGPIKMELEELRPKEREIIEGDMTFHPDSAYSWFDIHPLRLPLKLLFNRVQVIDQLNSMIDKYLEKFDLADEKLGLLGFSQGGALALYAALNRKKECGAVVSHSGPFIGLQKARSKPDTLMIIGDRDELYKPDDLFSIKRYFRFAGSLKRLKRRDVPVEKAVFKGLGHRANQESITKSIRFMRKKLTDDSPPFPGLEDKVDPSFPPPP